MAHNDDGAEGGGGLVLQVGALSSVLRLVRRVTTLIFEQGHENIVLHSDGTKAAEKLVQLVCLLDSKYSVILIAFFL